ncbi:MAG: sodium:proton antiporter [Synergistaceae bacterium]|jgi:multisubunit Na+/H+ antiporter MnhB subunit|nr:sodium:proton antiporter [Synergistaceae bacterium]
MIAEKRYSSAHPFLILLLMGLGLAQALFAHLRPGDGFTGGAIVALALLAVTMKNEEARLASPVALVLFEGVGLAAFLVLSFLGMGATLMYNVLVGRGGVFGGTLPAGHNGGQLFTSGTIALFNLSVVLIAAGALGRMARAFFLADSQEVDR